MIVGFSFFFLSQIQLKKHFKYLTSNFNLFLSFRWWISRCAVFVYKRLKFNCGLMSNKDVLKTTIPVIYCGLSLRSFPHLRVAGLTTRWGEKHGGR